MKSEPAPFSRVGWFLPVGLALYALFCFFSINKPLTTDEAEIGSAILATARTGKPIYYMGDNPDRYWPAKDMWQKQEAPRPEYKYGLWHAPLHVYLTALGVKLFGAADWVMRLPGVLCFLGTLWLVRGIFRHLFPPDQARHAFGLAALFYLINPLLIQEGLMLDVDNTVVTFASVLYLHEFLRLEQRPTAWAPKYAWLCVIIALTFWAKEFAGLYVALPAFGYVVLQRRWREAFGVVASLLVGTALFWVTWWMFCKMTGLPVMYFIRFTILGKLAIGEGLLTTMAKQSGWLNAWFTVWFSVFVTMVWVSPYYLVAFLGLSAWRVREFLRAHTVRPLDLLWLFCLVIFGVTHVYRPSGWFLKYEYPGVAVLVIMFGALVFETFKDLPAPRWIAGGLLALAMGAAQVAVLDDPVFKLFNGGLKGLGDTTLWGFYAVAFIALFAVVKLANRSWPWLRAGTGALAIAILGANLSVNLKQLSPYVTSISWNNYGESGFAETADYLRQTLRPDDVPICRKDFGYYLYRDSESMYRRWINPVVITDMKSGDELVANITAPGVTCIVLDRYCMRRDTIPIIQQLYVVEKQIGSFYVLRRRDR